MLENATNQCGKSIRENKIEYRLHIYRGNERKKTTTVGDFRKKRYFCHHLLIDDDMKNLPRILFLTLFCLLPAIQGWSTYIKFYTPRHTQLTSSQINCILQDSQGYIWISTQNGVSKFDGQRFTQYYHHRNDSNSLFDNYQSLLFEDSRHRLWVGGLQTYNYDYDHFDRITYRNTDGKPDRPFALTMIERKSHELWIGTSTGIYVTDATKETVEPRAADFLQRIRNERIQALHEDDNQNVWIGCDELGLVQYTPDGKMEFPITATGAPVHHVSDICSDDENNLYVASLTDGLFVKKTGTKFFQPIALPNSVGHCAHSLLWQHSHRRLLVGMDGDGLKAYRSETGQAENIQLPNAPFPMDHLKVHVLYEDRSGNLWMGLYQKGVLMFPGEAYAFSYYGHRTADTHNLIGSGAVLALHVDHDGKLWVGTDNDGLYCVDTEAHRSEHWDRNRFPRTVMNITEDPLHQLWIATYHDGLLCMAPDRKSWRKIPVPEGFNERVSCLAICQDQLWMGTYGTGLAVMDLKTRRYTHLLQTTNSKLKDDWITCLYPTDKGEMWIGSTFGLCKFDGKELVDFSERWGNELYGRNINCLFTDKENNLWIGTRYGLYRWNEETRQLTHLTTDDGLPNNYIYSLKEDEAGNLWISTVQGLSKYRIREQTFSNFSENDGLQGNEFGRASCTSPDGRFFFGGINGITEFRPQDIKAIHRDLHLTLTQIYVHNEPIHFSSNQRELTMEPTDNTLSLDFTTFEFNTPERVNYQYRLAGEKEVWTDFPDHQHRLTFVKLQPGTYKFHCRAIHGKNVSPVETFTLHILPPWYFRGWAWCIWCLLTAVLLGFLGLYVRSVLRERQYEARIRQQEELNESKMQFFVNITHEIRTPLSLIAAPLEKLMLEPSDKQPVYRLMYRNAQRLIQLMNQLLDVRKIEKRQMKLIFHATDLIAYTETVIQSFSYTSQQKKVQLDFVHDKEPITAYIDRSHFDKILMNLIGNAFKYTPEQGSICVRLHREKGWIELVVEDTGIGIPSKDLPHLFERFYQGQQLGNKRYFGTGIGLHLAYSIALLHHGSLRAEQRKDTQGSRFVLMLPEGCIHLRDEEIATEQDTEPATALPEEDMATAQTEVEVNLMTENDTVSPQKHRFNVVIVDDEFELRQYVSHELVNEFVFREFDKAEEALKYILREKPDLVISDVMMEGMDGITLCRKLKGNVNSRHIPVVLLTAKSNVKDKVEGLESGADAYIVKPFHIEELRSTLHVLIKRSRQVSSAKEMEQLADKEIEDVVIKSAKDGVLEEIVRIINKHLDDPKLNVNLLAEECKIHRVQLYRILKETTGQSPLDFIRSIRLKQAARLLAESDATISEIAYGVGYSNVSHFSSIFRQFYGELPSEYREKRKKD